MKYNEIKSFNQLTEIEKVMLFDFLNQKEENPTSSEKLRQNLTGRNYDFGNSFFVLIQEQQIMGAVQLHFEENSKSAYIRQFNIAEDTTSTLQGGKLIGTQILDQLIQYSLSQAKNHYGAEFVAIGIREEEMKKKADSLGYVRSYQTVVMKLTETTLRHSTLELEPLCENNREEYMKTFNESFGLIPNGGTITLEEVTDYLNRETEEYFIVKDSANTIGILELFPESEDDHFVIGISPVHQGKGYGKHILETAIDELSKRGISEILMDVITRRQKAFEMYKKRGFEVVKVYTQWFMERT